MRRFSMAATIVCASGFFFAQAVSADEVANFPNKPIKIIVAYQAGGTADIVTRRIAERLTERLKQPVLVENKPGGNTIIASEFVARAPADGYTLYSTNTSLLQIPYLYPVKYDPIKDFKGVTQYAMAPVIMSVPGSTPVTNLQELAGYLKKKPGKSTYAVAGVGGTQHILGESLKKSLGIDSIQVPYKGDGPLMTDFIGGLIDWYMATPLSVMPHVKTGKVRLLAVSGPARLPLTPDVPTFRELGFPDLAAVGWYGLFAPAATPQPILNKISREVSAIIKSQEMSSYLQENGLIPTGLEAEQFAPEVLAIRESWAKMIKELNIRID